MATQNQPGAGHNKGKLCKENPSIFNKGRKLAKGIKSKILNIRMRF